MPYCTVPLEGDIELRRKQTIEWDVQKKCHKKKGVFFFISERADRRSPAGKARHVQRPGFLIRAPCSSNSKQDRQMHWRLQVTYIHN